MTAAKLVTPSALIHDWNERGRESARPIVRPTLLDETLRDGLQSPSVRDPGIDDKRRIVRAAAALGVDVMDIGLPGAGPRAVRDVKALCELIRDERLPVKPACAARTLPEDIAPVLAIAEQTGVPIEVLAFLGVSPIRAWAEGWSRETMRRLVRVAVRMGVSAGMPVSFVTEDTVRAHPEVLEDLFLVAVEEGAQRVVVCDTVGHATPEGVYALVSWTRALLDRAGAQHVGIDFHGHNDRGLALTCSMTALKAGADRVHGTALGIGERVGNCSLDQLLVNLALLGASDRDLSGLSHYCQTVSRATGVPIARNHPVVGDDAFRTATGVHAAAIVKAEAKGGAGLADIVYSGVPSQLVGRQQEIVIGPLSGDSNVVAWLTRRQLPTNPTLVAEIRRHAKASERVLGDDELLAIVARCLLAEPRVAA